MEQNSARLTSLPRQEPHGAPHTESAPPAPSLTEIVQRRKALTAHVEELKKDLHLNRFGKNNTDEWAQLSELNTALRELKTTLSELDANHSTHGIAPNAQIRVELAHEMDRLDERIQKNEAAMEEISHAERRTHVREALRAPTGTFGDLHKAAERGEGVAAESLKPRETRALQLEDYEKQLNAVQKEMKDTRETFEPLITSGAIKENADGTLSVAGVQRFLNRGLAQEVSNYNKLVAKERGLVDVVIPRAGNTQVNELRREHAKTFSGTRIESGGNEWRHYMDSALGYYEGKFRMAEFKEKMKKAVAEETARLGTPNELYDKLLHAKTEKEAQEIKDQIIRVLPFELGDYENEISDDARLARFLRSKKDEAALEKVETAWMEKTKPAEEDDKKFSRGSTMAELHSAAERGEGVTVGSLENRTKAVDEYYDALLRKKSDTKTAAQPQPALEKPVAAAEGTMKNLQETPADKAFNLSVKYQAIANQLNEGNIVSFSHLVAALEQAGLMNAGGVMDEIGKDGKPITKYGLEKQLTKGWFKRTIGKKEAVALFEGLSKTYEEQARALTQEAHSGSIASQGGKKTRMEGFHSVGKTPHEPLGGGLVRG